MDEAGLELEAAGADAGTALDPTVVEASGVEPAEAPPAAPPVAEIVVPDAKVPELEPVPLDGTDSEEPATCALSFTLAVLSGDPEPPPPQAARSKVERTREG